jgi:hypothetical protein
MPIKFSDYMPRPPEEQRQAIEARAAELIEEEAALREHLHRRRMFEESNTTFEALRADPVAWAEELAERAAWEGTLLDGLDDD